MPYVQAHQRVRLDSGAEAETAGELNYLVTRLVDAYIAAHGGVRYERLNEVVGVLECVKLELYRRVAAPYEDGKCAAHGDVYTVLD